MLTSAEDFNVDELISYDIDDENLRRILKGMHNASPISFDTFCEEYVKYADKLGGENETEDFLRSIDYLLYYKEKYSLNCSIDYKKLLEKILSSYIIMEIFKILNNSITIISIYIPKILKEKVLLFPTKAVTSIAFIDRLVNSNIPFNFMAYFNFIVSTNDIFSGLECFMDEAKSKKYGNPHYALFLLILLLHRFNEKGFGVYATCCEGEFWIVLENSYKDKYEEIKNEFSSEPWYPFLFSRIFFAGDVWKKLSSTDRLNGRD
ncbi:hypothetical protein [Acidianus sp. HS-5]|uniref:hypothetical protein n=1 Tax=Acidianus sp. HS-5 TaxID=2886040 RepID=UPI001F21F06C|nr:hypothetical protein [Acidianus sp. HS-5]BDC17364.1 hypothetical protein HS5_02540 [Acidianus sp. HS-5]